MKRGNFAEKLLKAANHYLLFFMVVAFVITCCMMLFLSVLSRTLQISFTEQDIQTAAKLTFANVVLLSLIFTIIDALRRRFTTGRITKRITEAAQRVVNGDFSVRIAPVSSFSTDDSFNEIIRCFNKMASELAGVETLRTDFVSNVSHEMKTPLSVMQNYATLLASPSLDDAKRREYAAGIMDACKRLSDMITNILRLNRLENQQIFPVAETFDLGEMLCECLLQYESVWEEAEIEIDTDIAENVIVNADAELLGIVWSNLFSNAFKFTPRGGRVSVSLSATQQYAVVKVQDTGCGISHEVGQHIFEKFYQGDTSHASRGNGLGLALVKRVVDILGGEISVESTVGKGSAFTVKVRRV